LRRWAAVAAIATGEFAFVARWVRRLLLDSAGLPAPDEPDETLRTLATPEGARECIEAIDALAHDALTGRVWKLADELSKELEHQAIPLGEDWVAGRIAKLIELAARLEVDFNRAARHLTPFEDWIAAPEWFRPTREGEIAPAG
jgi:hypothetical protein